MEKLNKSIRFCKYAILFYTIVFAIWFLCANQEKYVFLAKLYILAITPFVMGYYLKNFQKKNMQ